MSRGYSHTYFDEQGAKTFEGIILELEQDIFVLNIVSKFHNYHDKGQ